MDRTDIAVVGAGPAGAWAARALARAGARVLIFDASHPREKPCGGGLTARTLAHLRGTGAEERLDAVPVTGVVFDPPDGAGRAKGRNPVPARVPLTACGPCSPVPLAVVSRKWFDAVLLDLAVGAGARHVSERVRDLEPANGGVLVRTTHRSVRADRVFGADGAMSLVRRRLSVPFRRSQLSMATGLFVYGHTGTDIRIRLLGEPGGYLWSFPRRDHLAVGACAQADAASVGALRAAVTRWVAGTTATGGTARMEPYTWPIPSLSYADFDVQTPAGTRWLVVGDAAGLADPLTREGLPFALRSAELAAAAVAAPRAETEYALRLHDELYPELRRAAALKAGFFRPGFTTLLVDALGRSGPVRQVMADLIAGQQPYRGLRRRLLGTLELGLAWRLLGLELRGRLHG